MNNLIDLASRIYSDPQRDHSTRIETINGKKYYYNREDVILMDLAKKQEFPNIFYNNFFLLIIDNVNKITEHYYKYDPVTYIYFFSEKTKTKIGSNVLIKLLDVYKDCPPDYRLNKNIEELITFYTKIHFNLIEIDDLIFIKKILIDRNYKLFDFAITIMNRVKLDDETIHLIIDNGLFDVYKNLTVKPEHLLSACGAYTKKLEFIEFIIYKQKIIPTHEHFEKFLKSDHIDTQLDSEFLDHLCKIGLIINLDDVKSLAKVKVDVKNLDELGIAIDDEFIKICIDNNFKSKYLINHGLSQEEIQNLFLKFTRLSDIKKIIGNNKVTFDVTCLENTCTLPNNSNVIKFLLKQGIRANVTCMKNIIVSTVNSSPIIAIVESYIKSIEKK